MSTSWEPVSRVSVGVPGPEALSHGKCPLREPNETLLYSQLIDSFLFFYIIFVFIFSFIQNRKKQLPQQQQKEKKITQ